jgi:biopolymer transport protein ExbD
MTDLLPPVSSRKKSSGFGKAKKLNIRIDMTPMVDLGFLLITFFIFTSTMTDPKAMLLNMPDDKGAPTPTKKSGALTLIAKENGMVYYYEGDLPAGDLNSTTVKGIRKIIVDKKLRTPTDDLFIIIKPSRTSTYRNVVDLLDEMTISVIKRYALVKITSQEESMLK